VNIDKIRLSGNPVLSYYFPAGQTQSLANRIDTIVKYPTAEARNGTGTGITYSASTGVFKNSNSYSVVVNVSATVITPQNTVGTRVMYITNSGQGVISYSSISPNLSDGSALCISGNFILNSDETFYVTFFQSSGDALVIGGNPANRITILVL
jgi:hypothetical protein